MIYIARAVNGEFYARIHATNGKEVWRTSETYKRKRSALTAVSIAFDVLNAAAGCSTLTKAEMAITDLTLKK